MEMKPQMGRAPSGDLARQTAEAVTRRYERDASARRAMKRRANVSGCLAWIVAGLVALAAGTYFACHYFGVDPLTLPDLARERIDQARRARRFAKIEEVFRSAPLREWRDAPQEIRPRNVPTNTVYHAMMPDAAEGRVLIELTARRGGGMSAVRLHPARAPEDFDVERFRDMASRSPYLISAGGDVYFCSSGQVSSGSPRRPSMESFRQSLLSARR